MIGEVIFRCDRVNYGYSDLGLGNVTGSLYLFPVNGGLGPQRSLGSLPLTMDTFFPSQAFSLLALLALVLMVVVTGGVVYLTAAEWRDRRRRKRDQDSAKPSRPNLKK